jgi:FMN-dependent NADH-azoreductase
MTLFRLDASIRVEGSASREIADIVEQEWLAAHPGDQVERRHIGVDVLPADAWGHAVSAGFVPPEQHTAEQANAVKLATTLTDELVNADAVLLAVPLYNWGVSQHFKTWFDLIMTDPPRTRLRRPDPGQAGSARHRPRRRLRPGHPQARLGLLNPVPAPHAHRTVGATLTVVERELTLAAVNPALEPLRDLATQLHQQALSAATEAGRAFGVPPTK